MNTGRVLLITEGEGRAVRDIRATLGRPGEYGFIEANTLAKSMAILHNKLADLILLDFDTPNINGFEACRLIRASSNLPLIVISSHDGEHNKVEAFDAGADDYVTIPWSTQELRARIRAHIRRLPREDSEPKRFISGDLEIDFLRRSAVSGGKRVHLTPKEHDLLHLLVSQAGRPVAHRKLLQAVWGVDYGDELEYLRTLIHQLRRKIEPEPSRPKYLLTEPWVGYCFAVT